MLASPEIPFLVKGIIIQTAIKIGHYTTSYYSVILGSMKKMNNDVNMHVHALNIDDPNEGEKISYPYKIELPPILIYIPPPSSCQRSFLPALFLMISGPTPLPPKYSEPFETDVGTALGRRGSVVLGQSLSSVFPKVLTVFPTVLTTAESVASKETQCKMAIPTATTLSAASDADVP